ncbi:MAG: prephenate dehydratase [Kiritimatiellae bacterium]|nr:prephenate dehydratase [Kiritimatiellia bacterium]
MSLDDLRGKIDGLDADLVRLLNERTRLALEIGRVKEAGAQEVYVPAREKAVLDRVDTLNAGPLPAESMRAIYREIMSASLALERKVAIAYLGPPATFTHQAARSRFGASVQYAPCETIGEVFAAVEKKSADYGVVPIENSTDGAVTHTLDQFTDTPLKICAEIYLPISHNLLAKCPKGGIKRLYSKPEVFGQCRRWLHENMPGVELISSSSTARAAETAAREPGSGALASALTADLYGLDLLEQDIQDLGGNTTRFLVIGPRYGAATGRDKTSLLFAVKHRVGALYDALSAFKRYQINMTKIESRPSKTKAWEYYFFVDLEGHADDPPVQKALADLGEHCTLMTVLGAYPRAAGPDA